MLHGTGLWFVAETLPMPAQQAQTAEQDTAQMRRDLNYVDKAQPQVRCPAGLSLPFVAQAILMVAAIWRQGSHTT